MPEEFRPLTAHERAIIERLLEEPFEGRDEVRLQLDACSVRRIPGCEDHCGSLEFEVQSERLIPNSSPHDVPLPVSGWAPDVDGIPIQILLFHRNGLLRQLEFVVFSDRMKRMPAAREVRLGDPE